MVGWHHHLNGHVFEQAPGVGDAWGGLACYSPQGVKESDRTGQLTETEYSNFHDYEILASRSEEVSKNTKKDTGNDGSPRPLMP